MNKLLFISIISISTLNHSAIAKKIRQCDSRVPEIKLTTAITLAKNYVINTLNFTGDVFVDEAKLNCRENELVWLLGLRKTDYETGHLYLSVNMSSSINIESIVKDH